MTKWKDFLEEKPSPKLRQQIFERTEKEMARPFRLSFKNWYWAIAPLATTAFIFIFYNRAPLTPPLKDIEAHALFSDLELDTIEDIELLNDIDILEELEVIEEWEQS